MARRIGYAINFECGYRVEFERALRIPSIRHIITLGEPVFQVLRERYSLTELAPKIRAVLTQAYDKPPAAILADREVSLLPLPHIFNVSNRRWEFYDDFLRERLPRLSPCYQAEVDRYMLMLSRLGQRLTFRRNNTQ